MPKISEIEPTPNPNAMKFILREPLTWGITRSYDNAGQAAGDPLAAALFDVEHVTNVFYEGPTAFKAIQIYDPNYNGRYHSEVVKNNVYHRGDSGRNRDRNE